MCMDGTGGMVYTGLMMENKIHMAEPETLIRILGIHAALESSASRELDKLDSVVSSYPYSLKNFFSSCP